MKSTNYCAFFLFILVGFLVVGLFQCGDDDDDDSEDLDDDDDNNADDDDVADDDDAGDDDDDDDDNDDDDTVPEDYIYDDDSRDSFTNGKLIGTTYAITMTPSGYPANLVEVSVFIGGNVNWSHEFNIVILADENGDGPQETEIIYTSPSLTAQAEYVWTTHDLAAKSTPPSLASGSWIVGVRQLMEWGPPVGIDFSATTPVCYQYNTVDWSVYPIEGVLMIRGKGNYSP